MPARTRGAWTSAQTHEVLLEAARASLCHQTLRGHDSLEIADVLNRANKIWAVRYKGTPGATRELTRGAITSQWRTVDQLQESALLSWFDSSDLVRTPSAYHLKRDVLHASAENDIRIRRRELRNAFARFVTSAVLGDSDRVLWTLRYLVLCNSNQPPFQLRLQEGYSQRRSELLPVYRLGIRMAGWSASPKHLLDMHLSVIDGTLLQLSSNRTKRDLRVALLAGESARLICKGLPKATPKIDAWMIERLIRGLAESEFSHPDLEAEDVRHVSDRWTKSVATSAS